MSTETQYQITDSFDNMDLRQPILRGIYAYGFEKPSTIQQQAIVPMTTGRDIIAQAQSGTGKTGTFSIGVLQLIDENVQNEQAIILSPTRELARQTYKVITSLACHTKIVIKEVIGGQFQNRYQSYKSTSKKAQIIVGTPGKVLDELSKNRIDCKTIKLLVLDEADEMLSKGFTEQVQKIFGHIPSKAQVGLFSATLSPEILEITEQFMNDPYKILIKNEELTLEGIKQFYIDVEKESYKYDTLCDLYSAISISQCIIYCNTRKKVHFLSNKLKDNNFTVSCIYGDMPQNERNRVMDSFRSGDTRILITTDILARGIDVQQVSLVINYDVPNEVETYIHRSGRAGRHGRRGVTITFVSGYDYEQMKNLEKFYNTEFQELPANFAGFL